MEPVDAAYQKCCAFVEQVVPEYWESIVSEADVRMKVVDRIFSSILGWPLHETHLESSAGPGFIDYRLTVAQLNRLVVEAKKEARDLGIADTHAGRYFKLNGSVFKTDAALEGIEQAIRYCGHRNAELACVTNGRQWVVFRGNRQADGKDTIEGMACVFGSLSCVKDRFSLFYDLLSYEGVRDFRYRGIFQEAEGQPIRSRQFRSLVRRPESRQFLESNKLSRDVDRVILSFFRDLGEADDAEARRQCFVTTKESTSAAQQLARISEELRDKVKSITGPHATEIAEAIRRVQEMRRQELVLLVGTKGSGKSTFVERFFADDIPSTLANDCVVVKVDLASCGCDSTRITKWLDERCLEATERATFRGRHPTYDELEGMYWSEYNRWREGHAKHLYTSDKTAFKIEFGKHIDRRREERPHEYIVHLLQRVVFGLKLVPCLVFDNADHFDVPFQEEVFKYAHALYKECLCLVIVPITDTTSWQLARQGPMQSFYTESFYLPTPPIEQVLRKRIEYIEYRISEEKPEVGRGYFLTRGIELEIENIKAFTACLQTLFINTGQVAEWIGRLANHDVRRCLQLARELLGSSHIRLDELLKAYLARTSLEVNSEDIMLAMIRGKYDIYPSGSNAFVQNVFNMVSELDTSPLVCVRILQFLDAAWDSNPANDARYVTVTKICEYFRAMSLDPRAIELCLNEMLKTGLALGYDPTATRVQDARKIEISPSGRQHLTWALRDWVYIESMAEVTPLLDPDACSQIGAALQVGVPFARRSAIREFVQYLTTEDATYCTVPKHELYTGQSRVRDALVQQLCALQPAGSAVETGRYARLMGKLVSWHADRGFGFIRYREGKPSAFLHVRDVAEADVQHLREGSDVEFEVVLDAKGPKAIRAVIVAVGR